MLTWIREKFGTVIIGTIISLITLVFVFYGIFSPKATRGLGEGSVAGTVNGDPISLSEFNRAYAQRTEFFKALGGGKISEEQLASFHIRESVFQELVRRRVMIQEAQRQGLAPSDEEVREKIQEIPAFQKDGKFDVGTYKQVLQANNYSPGTFERMVQDDLSQEMWDRYFKDRVHTSTDEIVQQFLTANDKRDVKYVLLTSETGQRGVKVAEADVQKFLADPGRMNIARARYEQKKNSEYKGKAFEAIQDELVRRILVSEKVEEVSQVNQRLAEQVLSAMTADKSSDAKVNALLKPYGVEVKTTGLFNRQAPGITGVGESPELLKDAFAAQSPINPSQGGKVKKYSTPAWTLVAVVVGAEKPDLAKLEVQRQDIAQQISMRKERELMDEWSKALVSHAKVDANPSVLTPSG